MDIPMEENSLNSDTLSDQLNSDYDSESDDAFIQSGLKKYVIGLLGCEETVLSLCRRLYMRFELRVLPIYTSTPRYIPYLSNSNWMKDKLEDVIQESDIIINVCSDIKETEDMLFYITSIKDYRNKFFIETGHVDVKASNKVATHIIENGGQYLEIFVQSLSRVLFESATSLSVSGPKQTYRDLKPFLATLAYKTNTTYLGEIGASFKFRNFIKMSEIINLLTITNTVMVAKHSKIDERLILYFLGKTNLSCKELVQEPRIDEFLSNDVYLNFEMFYIPSFIKSFKKHFSLKGAVRPFMEHCFNLLTNVFSYGYKLYSIWGSLHHWSVGEYSHGKMPNYADKKLEP